MKNARSNNRLIQLGRRAFLVNSSMLMMGITTLLDSMASDPGKLITSSLLNFGILTDVHYADKETAGSRYYRESTRKMREAIDRFNQSKLDFIIELGDFVDAADSVEVEQGYLTTIHNEFKQFEGPCHYVLGNHCVWTLTKDQFLKEVDQKKSYFSFDLKDHHFIILDACFREDGVAYGAKNYQWTDTEIPPKEREWLQADLESTSKDTLVFVHQRIDVENHYGIKSGKAVRDILEASGKVKAVFQGHNHVNEYQEIGGIHYCTLAAMVDGSGKENNAYSTVHLLKDGGILLNGFRQHEDYHWKA